jgi:phosphatidylglycerophosphate synthase
MTEVPNRRPLKTRSAAWPLAVARMLARVGLTPNAVSVIGIGFGLLGGFLFMTSAGAWSGHRRAALLVGAAVCIQLRLVCNLLDGLIAVECGLKSKVGDLFNEVPDRIEDTAFLLGAGFGAAGTLGITLGWTASLLAVGAAYVRVLGGSLGFPQDFVGPGAKQHRMALLTVGALLGAVEAWFSGGRRVLAAALALIIIATLITVVRRLGRIARAMQAR